MRESPPQCSGACVMLLVVLILLVNFVNWVVFKDPMAIVLASLSAILFSCYIGLTIYERVIWSRMLEERRNVKARKRAERLRRKELWRKRRNAEVQEEGRMKE